MEVHDVCPQAGWPCGFAQEPGTRPANCLPAPLSMPGAQAEGRVSGARMDTDHKRRPSPCLRGSPTFSAHLHPPVGWERSLPHQTSHGPQGFCVYMGCEKTEPRRGPSVVHPVIHVNQGGCLVNNSKLLQIYASFPLACLQRALHKCLLSD